MPFIIFFSVGVCASVVNEIARLYNNIILHAQYYTYRKVILHNIIRNAVLLDEQAYTHLVEACGKASRCTGRKKMCLWRGGRRGMYDTQSGFPVRVETKITETSGQNDLRSVGEVGDRVGAMLQPPRCCSCRRITFGNGTRCVRGSARCAIKFVENCQPRNMNGEITGKSHFRVCCIQT